MIMLYWLPSTMLPTLCMLPVASMAGMLSGSASSVALVGSLQGDLE